MPERVIEVIYPVIVGLAKKKKKLFPSKGSYLRSGVYMYVFSPSPFSLFQMLSQQNFLFSLLEHSLLILFYLFRWFLICALRLKQRKPYGAGWLLKEWEVCVACKTAEFYLWG